MLAAPTLAFRFLYLTVETLDTENRGMTFSKFTVALGLAACIAAAAGAEDKVVLKSGVEWVGEIVNSAEHFITIRVTHGTYVKDMTFFRGDIAEIIEDAMIEADAGAEADTAAADAELDPAPEYGQGKPVIIRLPLTGTVGMEFRHDEIEYVADHADKVKKETGVSPIIVLEIESGGGLMLEMYNIHETLMEVKKRHRVVAWIKEAISAAAATAFHCDEIYFRTDASLGAMTGFNGGTGIALKDEALAQWLSDAAEWAEAGGRFGGIAKAMIHNPFELSYDVDENDNVTWYDTLEGEYDLSTAGDNLVFNASHAEQSGFADGIADSEAELAELLDLDGWSEDEFGKAAHEDWMALYEKAHHDIPYKFQELEIIQGSAAADPEQKINAAIKLLKELIDWWDLAPFVCEFEFGLPPKEDLERAIRELQKQLSDIKERD